MPSVLLSPSPRSVCGSKGCGGAACGFQFTWGRVTGRHAHVLVTRWNGFITKVTGCLGLVLHFLPPALS